MSKKRGKRMRKAVGFSLDSEFERATRVQDDSIEIYTDSHEMIPERDDITLVGIKPGLDCFLINCNCRHDGSS